MFAIYTFLFSFVLATMEHIQIQATFVKCEKASYNQKTFHLRETTPFVDPVDCVNMVVKKKTVLEIDKIIDVRTFHHLFHEISDYLQDKVPLPYSNNHLVGVVDEPQSLYTITSQKLGETTTAKQLSGQPKMLSEAQACHLRPEELVEFFKLYPRLDALRQQFTICGIQKFFFHFYKTCERLDLNLFVKKELTKVKNKLATEILNSIEKKSIILENEWIFISLGLFQHLNVCNSNQTQFFFHKFRIMPMYLRYASPIIPYAFSKFIPSESDCKNSIIEISSLNADSRCYSSSFDPPKLRVHQFFLSLCAFEEAVWRESWHEVFAYATELFGFYNFSHDPVWGKYYLYVWGGVALACATLALLPTFAFSCLSKAQQLIVTHSDEIDVLHYKQQIMAAFHFYTEEDQIFKNLISLVPRSSRFYRKIMYVHLKSKQEEIQQNILHLWYLKNKEVKKDCKEDRVYNQREIDIWEDKIKSKCNNQIRFLYQLLSIPLDIWEEQKYETELLVIRLLLLVSQPRDWNINAQKEILDVSFQNIEHHLSCFVSFYNNSLTFDQYQHELSLIKRQFQNQTRLVHNLLWAHIGLSHLLLLKCTTNYAPQSFIDSLYKDVYHIFEKFKHPNAYLLHKSLINKRPFNWPKLDLNLSVNHDCSWSWIIKNNSQVQTFIRLGAISAIRFDIVDKSNYWITVHN